MSLSKEERQSVAAAEVITNTIAKRKETKESAKEGVDLVGLTEKLAKRRAAAGKE